MDGLAIAAALTTISKNINGGIVRSIYQPERGSFIMQLFAGKDLRLLISLPTAHIHWTSLDLPHLKTPSPFVMLLRKYLQGGKIVQISQPRWERVISLQVQCVHGKETFRVVIELLGPHGNLILLQENMVVAALRAGTRTTPGNTYVPLPTQNKLEPGKASATYLRELLSDENPDQALVRNLDGIGRNTAAAILALATTYTPGPVEQRAKRAIAFVLSKVEKPEARYDPHKNWASFFPLAQEAEKTHSFAAALDREFDTAWHYSHDDQELTPIHTGLSRAIASRKRTISRLQAWLVTAQSESHLRYRANLIMIHLNELNRGMDKATLTDPATEETVPIPLERELNPVENAQQLYMQAKRMHRGRPIVAHRIDRIKRELSLLQAGLSDVEAGRYPNQSAISLIPPVRSRKREQAPTSAKIYTIQGYTVQVGTNATQNDALLRKASPQDLWFHVKDIPGAHVILRCHDKQIPPIEVIREAARLAAAGSKARDEARVEVSYTRVKYVRKPKGSPAGLVILTQEDTLTVNPTGKVVT